MATSPRKMGLTKASARRLWRRLAFLGSPPGNRALPLNLHWFELQTRGPLEGGKVQHYQVVLKIGFTIDDNVAA